MFNHKKYYQSEKGKKNRKITLKKHNDKRQIWIQHVMHNLKINGCAECGYNKCDAALSFHHANPEDKKYNLKQNLLKYSEETIVAELNKCILFCANCHRELHWRESHGN
jgi:hypothetical protein